MGPTCAGPCRGGLVRPATCCKKSMPVIQWWCLFSGYCIIKCFVSSKNIMPSWCDLVTWFNLKDALFSGCFRFQVDQFRRWSKLLLPGTEWVILFESVLQESSHHFHVCVNTCRSFWILPKKRGSAALWKTLVYQAAETGIRNIAMDGEHDTGMLAIKSWNILSHMVYVYRVY